MPPPFATSTPVANTTTMVDDNVLVQYEFAPTDSTDVLQPGMCLCLMPGESSVTDRLKRVGKPSVDNAEECVGVVAEQCRRVTSGQIVKVVPRDRIVAGTQVWCDQNIAQGDIIGCHAGTYSVRKGKFRGPFLGEAFESVDRSTTAGVVRALTGPIHISPAKAARYVREVSIPFTVGLSGLQSFSDSGASIGSSGTGSALQGLQLTAGTTTDNSASVATTRQFKLELGKPLWFEVEVLPSLQTTFDIWAGLHSATPASDVVFDDSHALVTTSTDFVMLYKDQDDTAWTFGSCLNGTSDVSATAVASIASTPVTQRLGFYYDGVATSTNTKGTITPYINGVAQATKTVGDTPNAVPDTNFLLATVGLKIEGTSNGNIVVGRLHVEQPF